MTTFPIKCIGEGDGDGANGQTAMRVPAGDSKIATKKETFVYGEWMMVQCARRCQARMTRGNSKISPKITSAGSGGGDQGVSALNQADGTATGVVVRKEPLSNKNYVAVRDSFVGQDSREVSRRSWFSQLEDLEEIEEVEMEGVHEAG